MVAGPARLTLALALAAAPTAKAAPDAPRVSVGRMGAPADTGRARVPLVIAWDGGPAEVRIDGSSLGTAESPLTTPPVRWGAEVVLVRDGEASAPARSDGVWAPVDVASWSGAGLRGAHVTGLAPVDGGVWVSTDGGGLALWWSPGAPGDGVWTHLDRRVLGSDALVDVAAGERRRWVATRDAVLVIAPDGAILRWTAEALGATQILGVEADGVIAWVWHDAGLSRVGPAGVDHADPGPCTALFTTLEGPVAVCSDGARLLRTDEQLPGAAVTGAVRREGGWWIAGRAGLVAWVDQTPTDPWDVAPVHSLARVGDGLVVATGRAGAWARTIDGWLPLDRAQGLPGTTALAVAGLAPRDGAYGRAWVATDRGVGLARLEGVVAPLPLAPLAAAIPVRAVVPTSTGTGVATEDGLVWLGRGAPRGWDALVAAAGAPVHDLVRHGTSWWAVGPADALELTRAGTVRRWPTHSEALGAVSCGDRLGVLTSLGIRWWASDEQRTLSPTDRLVDARDPICVPGAVWWRTADGVGALVRGERRAWPVAATSLSAVGSGVLAAGDDGLWWLTGDHEPVRPAGWETPLPLVDAATAAGTLWALGRDGTLWWSRGAGVPVATHVGDGADRIVPIDADRAWVHGPAGAWLVRRLP